MPQWIRLDTDLGMPYKAFYVNLRHPIGLKLCQALAAAQNGSDTPENVAGVVETLVPLHRPELAGCIATYLQANTIGTRLHLGVVHPSLPRVPRGWPLDAERLDLCPQCGGVFGDRVFLQKYEADSPAAREVCSEACAARPAKG